MAPGALNVMTMSFTRAAAVRVTELRLSLAGLQRPRNTETPTITTPMTIQKTHGS